MIYYLIVILAVFSAACAQMLLKKGANLTPAHATTNEQRWKWWLKQYLNGWVIGGYVIMGLVMIVNIYAMSKGVQLKELGMIEALSYLFVPMLSRLIYHEKISPKKFVAIATIIVGIIVFFV